MTREQDVVRHAVRRELTTGWGGPGLNHVVVACSGGADSLALAAAAADVAARHHVTVSAMIVDHGLQPDSAAVASAAAEQCRHAGIADIVVVRVTVSAGGQGPEGDARRARYTALGEEAAQRGGHGHVTVMLGHTRDDQAESVLLGLGRGSGARSLSGMAPRRGVYSRPLLQLPRPVVRRACLDWGLQPWQDPHNVDRSYARVRVRTIAIPALEESLGSTVVNALARSADLLRDDADALDGWARDQWRHILGQDLDPGAAGVAVDQLAALPVAVTRRVIREFAAVAGVPVERLTADHLSRVAAMIHRWNGQGPVAVPGGMVVVRRSGRLFIVPNTDGFRRSTSPLRPPP